MANFEADRAEGRVGDTKVDGHEECAVKMGGLVRTKRSGKNDVPVTVMELCIPGDLALRNAYKVTSN